MKALVIAGVSSGVGKTTVSTAVMAALRAGGCAVAPFKVGPDYIDPGFHERVAGRPSCNLDSWMLSGDTIRYLFHRYAHGSDIAVVEGVMGMFDGCGSTMEGSTAHVARLIGAPVVLVADARGIAGSIGAMVDGYRRRDPRAALKGVILNNVSGERHYRLLAEAVMRDAGISCLGYLPRDPGIVLKSRHLGLVPAAELKGLDETLGRLAVLAGNTIDLAALEALAERARCPEGRPPAIAPGCLDGLTIAVACDEAFHFYYRANRDFVEECGARLIEWSPLHDTRLPPGADAAWIGGGFPEVYAAELAANTAVRADLRERAGAGMPVYAECGGLMYLARSLVDGSGTPHEMAGVLDCTVRMTDRLQRFGYVTVDWEGVSTRAHEFHHSIAGEWGGGMPAYRYTVTRASTGESWLCGLSRDNVLAGYPHIHFLSSPAFFEKIAALWKRKA